MDDAPILDRAIKRAGGAASVARAFGISPVSVGEWLKKGRLPPDRVIPVSALTDWEYTPHMLDSKLYPNERDGIVISHQPSQVAA